MARRAGDTGRYHGRVAEFGSREGAWRRTGELLAGGAVREHLAGTRRPSAGYAVSVRRGTR
jgi:hypothetical protein